MLCPSKRLRSLSLFLFAYLFVISSSFADGISSCLTCLYQHPPRWVFSAGLGGIVTSDVGESRFFPITATSSQFFIYSANNARRATPLLDGFLGAEFEVYPNILLQAGVGYDTTWNLDVHGSLLQGADVPSSSLFVYHYNVVTHRIMFETKLLYHWISCYHPYIFFGLGGAFNRAEAFATNVPPFLTVTRQYGDNTETSFTYSIGFGFDANVLDYLRFGIGYRFGDFGKIQLGDAKVDILPVSGTLAQDHFYASEILGQVTFLL